MPLSVAISHAMPNFKLDVRFDTPPGVTAIFGPSGAGKTTIVNAVAGLITPDQGRIATPETVFFDSAAGVNMPAHRRRVGYVFQDHRLFPHMTVGQNLTYGRRARGLAQDDVAFAWITELLGIEALIDRYPGSLSGGEKQRVAIGRALLSKPEVLLLDEPLASLDQVRRQDILPYLERLRDAAQIPILYVSHSVTEVARLANQVVLLEKGQQTRIGSVEEVFSDTMTAKLIGADDLGTVLFGKVVAHHDDGLTELAAAEGRLFLPRTSADIGQTQRVRIRAQDVMLSLKRPEQVSALNVLEGTISDISTDQSALVQIVCGGDKILSRITLRSLTALNLEIGQTIFAVAKTVSVARDDVGKG